MPYFRVRDTRLLCGGVQAWSEGFVLCLHPYISLELKLRLGRWIQSVFYIFILFH